NSWCAAERVSMKAGPVRVMALTPAACPHRGLFGAALDPTWQPLSFAHLPNERQDCCQCQASTPAGGTAPAYGGIRRPDAEVGLAMASAISLVGRRKSTLSASVEIKDVKGSWWSWCDFGSTDRSPLKASCQLAAMSQCRSI